MVWAARSCSGLAPCMLRSAVVGRRWVHLNKGRCPGTSALNQRVPVLQCRAAARSRLAASEWPLAVNSTEDGMAWRSVMAWRCVWRDGMAWRGAAQVALGQFDVPIALAVQASLTGLGPLQMGMDAIRLQSALREFVALCVLSIVLCGSRLSIGSFGPDCVSQLLPFTRANCSAVASAGFATGYVVSWLGAAEASAAADSKGTDDASGGAKAEGAPDGPSQQPQRTHAKLNRRLSAVRAEGLVLILCRKTDKGGCWVCFLDRSAMLARWHTSQNHCECCAFCLCCIVAEVVLNEDDAVS